MLPAEHRLRHQAQFSSTLRRGRRASRPTVSVHVLLPENDPVLPARAGLVVSKAVGNAVVRHRTARRLRHLLRPYLGPAAVPAAAGAGPLSLPAGSLVVVRANPAAATATAAALAADLDGALSSALRKAQA